MRTVTVSFNASPHLNARLSGSKPRRHALGSAMLKRLGACLPYLCLALPLIAAPGARAQDPATKRIFLPPPLQWDRAMLTSKPALQQTAADLANLTGGFAFGMSPSEVNANLPDPYPALSWAALGAANEYPGEVRYFWSRLDAVGPLRVGMTACAGAGSYVVFLFSTHGLFRLSYRLVADKDCANPAEAAQQVFARYVPIGEAVALSTRYRTGAAEVVDITDPTAGFLIPVRWRLGTN
jgi:hypothetical protein